MSSLRWADTYTCDNPICRATVTYKAPPSPQKSLESPVDGGGWVHLPVPITGPFGNLRMADLCPECADLGLADLLKYLYAEDVKIFRQMQEVKR